MQVGRGGRMTMRDEVERLWSCNYCKSLVQCTICVCVCRLKTLPSLFTTAWRQQDSKDSTGGTLQTRLVNACKLYWPERVIFIIS